MVGDLQHQEALTQLRGPYKQIGARIEQVFDQRRFGTVYLIIQLRHADGREIVRIRCFPYDPQSEFLIRIVIPVRFYIFLSLTGYRIISVKTYMITCVFIDFRRRIRYTLGIHV